MKLSGGEKQKIAFIREILKNSEVILADEPDAAAVIQEILLTLKKTCIVVTHRISSSLAGYDEILVMKDGKLVEVGNYYELMKQKGFLYQMSQNTI